MFIIKLKAKNATYTSSDILSKKAIDRRLKYNIALTESDFPVDADQVTTILRDTSLSLRYTLKWQNALVVNSSKNNIDYLLQNTNIASIRYVGKGERIIDKQVISPTTPVVKLKESAISTLTLSPSDYGVAYAQNKQIGAVALHQRGYDGKGVHLAVFDAGFKNINKIPGFMKAQSNQQLTLVYDCAGLDNELTNADNHGTAVSSCIGTYDKGLYIGSAPNAHLFLFRTEYGATEYPLEELNWCKAAEIADSIGVDMITSSLGYNQYDDKSLSYTHEDLDGHTSYIAQAAKLATQKGIIVLNSAGNSGDNKWRKIGTPADVSTVISVAAVDAQDKPGKFTSQGHNALGEIKPDIAAMGVLASVASPKGSYYQGYGTSYSTPIAAGGVACLIQAFPELSPAEVATLIKQTAKKSITPDSIVGYGVAQLDVAFMLQNARKLKTDVPMVLNISDEHILLYLPDTAEWYYQIKSERTFLKIFKLKQTVQKGTIATDSQLGSIATNSTKRQRSKKYTVKLSKKSGVGNYKLIYSDLQL